MIVRTKPCPFDHEKEYDPEIEDGLCRDCGKEIEPECGGFCACCMDGDCQCWTDALEKHACIPMMVPKRGVWECLAGHTVEMTAAEEMTHAGVPALF